VCSASCKPERRRKLQADSDAQCTGFNEQASNGKSNFSSVLFLGNRRKKHLFTQWSRDILAKSLTAVTPQRYSGNPKHDTMLKQKAGHTLVVCKTFFLAYGFQGLLSLGTSLAEVAAQNHPSPFWSFLTPAVPVAGGDYGSPWPVGPRPGGNRSLPLWSVPNVPGMAGSCTGA